MSITGKLAKSISDYERSASVGSKLRAKRIAPLLQMIEAVHRDQGRVNIVDIGGREAYWGLLPRGFLEAHDVRVTLVNLPGNESPEVEPPFSFVEADACDLEGFADASFDIAHSNSVIEHVGDWNRMVAFARELARVAPRYFVQTPNYWFPVEPHCMTPFFHWLPMPLRVWLVSRFRLGHWPRATTVDEAVRVVERARLLNRKMFQELFDDAEIQTERMLLLPKSFVAVKS